MKRIKTQQPNVVFFQHKNRKHNGKPDKRFLLRYRYNGKQFEEAVGWASQDWNAVKAAGIMAELKRNQRTGDGPTTLKEKRALEQAKKEAVEAQREREARESLTFRELFTDKYFPQAMIDKSAGSYDRERSLFKIWINPVIGALPLQAIAPIHLEKIKKNMNDKGRAPRSIQYCLAVVRQVFNYAYRNSHFNGSHPVKKIKIPKVDNKRMRFLTREEADSLLEDLQGRSTQLHDISLVCLHTGSRADEVFKLKWADVHVNQGTLILWDTKNIESRVVFMTGEVKEMFKGLERKEKQDLVFPDRKGNKIKQISKSFNRGVDALKLNESVTDSRQKVCFHTLRHTFASWHVQNGTDLYTLQKLLGQSDFKMVQRYAHLGENLLLAATQRFDAAISQPKAADVIEINQKRT